MAKLTLDLDAIQQLHQNGKLNEAKAGYLSLLKINPRDAHTLHALSILCAQQRDFSDATNYLKKAIELQPTNVSFLLHLANLYKAQANFQETENTLNQILKIDPEFVPAYNNFGTLKFSQGHYPEAISFYQKALEKQPDFIDAYYNLGLAYAKNQQHDAAIHTYQKLLALSPEHFAARFHLACALMNLQDYAAAEKEFLRIEAAQPYHFETQTNLATCFLKQAAMKEAKTHYLKALDLNKQDTQILYNLGTIEMESGNLDTAIQFFQRAVQIDKDFFAAHNNLGVAFIAKQQPSLALHHFKEALRLQPDNQSIQYLVEALSSKQRLLASPADYITTLFDAYADHYDSHLLKALDYQVPKLLYEAVKDVTAIPKSSWNILDLGCGTGLCGTLFKSAAKLLVGVDLSKNMQDVAASKHIYDDLVQSDLTPFLKNQFSLFDLVIAGDVFVYIGDLNPIFADVYQALRPEGLFTFNAEITDEADFFMNQSGRFAHLKTYLDDLAKKHQFTIVYYQTAITRLQNNSPVFGHIYVLKK